MKIILRAALMALSFASIGTAYADGGDGAQAANTQFTELPGVVAQVQVPNAPAYSQNGQVQREQARSQSSHGPWLFPPLSNYLPGAHS